MNTAAHTDLIVVGAGLAGGRTVLVLEAGTEVGGRARTRMVGSEPADIGGEWVGNAHRAVHALAAQLGIVIERATRWAGPSAGGCLRASGAQALPRAMAAELGAAVILDTPVHLIEDQGECVRVTTEDGTARTAAAVIVADWARDPWVEDCDIAFSPGQIRALGPEPRRHTGRLYFAGAERSSWPNNLEGAVQSGQHAATQLLQDAFHHPASETRTGVKIALGATRASQCGRDVVVLGDPDGASPFPVGPVRKTPSVTYVMASLDHTLCGMNLFPGHRMSIDERRLGAPARTASLTPATHTSW